MSDRHIESKAFEIYFNKAVAFLVGHGVGLMGARILAVRGRKSGEWRTNPVNPLPHDGARYLVSPRGQTHWVRNIRGAGGGELRLGRKVETIAVTEVPDAEKPPILRSYLKAWGWEVGRFFEGATKDSTDEEFAAIAPGFPVFRIEAS